MKIWNRMWIEEDGVLSFEWVLLVTLLTIGIVVGLAAARDAIIDELGDVAQGMLALDQSYSIGYAPDITIHVPPAASGPSDSAFEDAAQFEDCQRIQDPPIGQDAQDDAIPDGA